MALETRAHDQKGRLRLIAGRALQPLAGPLLALLFLGLSWQPAGAEDWVLHAVSTDGKIEEYYDRGSVSVLAPGVVQLTTKTIKYAAEDKGGKKKYNEGRPGGREALHPAAYTITQHRIECRNRLDTHLSSADYDRDGKQIFQSAEPWVIPRPPLRRPPQEIYPDSFSESLIKTVCPPAS
jgi:hypothetical protein